VFAALHQSLRVKRGSLFSLDDAKNNDLIFMVRPAKISRFWKFPARKNFLPPRAGRSANAGKIARSLPLARRHVDDFIFPACGPSSTRRKKNSFVLGISRSVRFSPGEPMKIKSLFFASSSENKAAALDAQRLMQRREHQVEAVYG